MVVGGCWLLVVVVGCCRLLSVVVCRLWLSAVVDGGGRVVSGVVGSFRL